MEHLQKNKPIYIAARSGSRFARVILAPFRKCFFKAKSVGAPPPIFLKSFQFSSPEDFRYWQEGFCNSQQKDLEPLEHYPQPVIDAWKKCVASKDAVIQKDLVDRV